MCGGVLVAPCAVVRVRLAVHGLLLVVFVFAGAWAGLLAAGDFVSWPCLSLWVCQWLWGLQIWSISLYTYKQIQTISSIL